jgi:hypothetical protein
MVSSSKIEIEKFNGKSFELWKLKMEYLLVEKDQWIIVDPGTAPTRMSTKDWEKLDQKEKSTIWLCLLDSVLLNVSGEATTKELWDKLGALYQSKSLGKQIVPVEEVVQPKDEIWRLGDRASEHLQYYVVSQYYLLILIFLMKISVSIYCSLYQTRGIVWLWP